LAHYEMNPRDLAHIIITSVLARGFGDVLISRCLISRGFKIEAEIQVSVEEAPLQLRCGWLSGVSGPQHIFRFGLSGKKRVDLQHWHTPILFDRDERCASLFQPGRTRHAEEMPGSIFHVVRINRLVRLELFAAIFEAPCIVTGYSALPVVWGL